MSRSIPVWFNQLNIWFDDDASAQLTLLPTQQNDKAGAMIPEHRLVLAVMAQAIRDFAAGINNPELILKRGRNDISWRQAVDWWLSKDEGPLSLEYCCACLNTIGINCCAEDGRQWAWDALGSGHVLLPLPQHSRSHAA